MSGHLAGNWSHTDQYRKAVSGRASHSIAVNAR